MLAIMFRPFGFLAPRFWLSCFDRLGFLLPDFGYHVSTVWVSCSQILAIMFRPFGFLDPRFWLSFFDRLGFMLPYFGSHVSTVWVSCSQILVIMLPPFGFLAPKDFQIIWLSNLLILSVHDEGYFRNALNLISTFLFNPHKYAY
jgi:hypothetical protein